ncbi:HIT family protein [Actinocorallia populi]|uniref:hypothetical protein n=1 Tax=Actinocorallia populi TaxID=2079200 RepID=UPI0013004C24|nr:hypothetical protein [Actinocorallia populi]
MATRWFPDQGGPAGEPSAHDCVLCPPLRFRLNEMAGLPPGVLARDADFYLAPDLAPLVEGHLLLVSERHWRCGGQLPPALWQRAEGWRAEVSGRYARAYGDPGVLVLEHGPASPGGGGACVDHFHWHLLPDAGALGGRVRAAAEAAGLTGRPAGHEALRRLHDEGRSYVMVGGHAYPADELPGQFLRGAVLGEGSPVWRWQELFGLPPSRRRFHATLKALARGQRCDSHQ